MEREAIDAWAESGQTLPAVLLGELLRSSPALGRSEVPLMPVVDRAALEQAVLPMMGEDSAFETAPVWCGAPVETGALARVHEHPAVAALRSRCANAVPSRMCLAIPARVVDLPEPESATVEVGGVRKRISLALVDGVIVGDYVIVHVGYALTKLDPDEAARTLATFAEAGLLPEAVA